MRVLGAQVLIRQDKKKGVTRAGIAVPTREKAETNKGTIIQIGDGAITDNGVRIPMRVAVGEKVAFSPYAGTKIIGKDGEELLLLKERDILLILEEGE